ncbi:MAG: 6,7-dimethyl-8-ribityllumazine synthase [Oceanipulchritudo sp.]
MSTDNPERLAIDGEGFRVGIVAARYNFNLVNSLLESVLETLDGCGVRQQDIETLRVPGSNEIPYIAAMMAKTGSFDVIIALGLIIAGETEHHSIIAHSTAHALQSVGIRFEIPVVNGIITVQNLRQAEDRITGELNRGAEFAHTALEMAQANDSMLKRILDQDMEDFPDDLDWMDDLEEDDPEDWRK